MDHKWWLQILKTHSYLCMIEEYAEHGDLLKRIKREKRLDELESRFLFRQLVEGIRVRIIIKLCWFGHQEL